VRQPSPITWTRKTSAAEEVTPGAIIARHDINSPLVASQSSQRLLTPSQSAVVLLDSGSTSEARCRFRRYFRGLFNAYDRSARAGVHSGTC
jgi:hypothetical protein